MGGGWRPINIRVCGDFHPCHPSFEQQTPIGIFFLLNENKNNIYIYTLALFLFKYIFFLKKKGGGWNPNNHGLFEGGGKHGA